VAPHGTSGRQVSPDTSLLIATHRPRQAVEDLRCAKLTSCSFSSSSGLWRVETVGLVAGSFVRDDGWAVSVPQPKRGLGGDWPVGASGLHGHPVKARAQVPPPKLSTHLNPVFPIPTIPTRETMTRYSPPLLRRFFSCAATSASPAAGRGAGKKNLVFLGSPQVLLHPQNPGFSVRTLVRWSYY
jgi:hypothetical protein